MYFLENYSYNVKQWKKGEEVCQPKTYLAQQILEPLLLSCCFLQPCQNNEIQDATVQSLWQVLCVERLNKECEKKEKLTTLKTACGKDVYVESNLINANITDSRNEYIRSSISQHIYLSVIKKFCCRCTQSTLCIFLCFNYKFQ